ncbi:MAG: cobalamin biosynthesis protein [Oscillospiraceae bacterium]|nr:cobalamin biosynthesis protein [Oscillospiraceae bacterium]
MQIELIAFTPDGFALGQKLAGLLAGQGDQTQLARGFGKEKTPLSQWCGQAFAAADALLFIGAAGIAVRAVAPLLAGKDTDPAVLVMDDTGRFCIPLLSGHIGGANDLACRVAALTGAQPVVTTATDRHGVFAFDQWAARRGLKVCNLQAVKRVSGKLLQGKQVRLRSDFPVEGALPPGVILVADKTYDVRITIKENCKKNALCLVPPVAVVGAGCRKGISCQALAQAYQMLLAKGNIRPEAVREMCSISLKAEEAGLLAFCQEKGFPLRTFTAQQLNEVKGSFSASAFVQKITGTDNVCERSAVLGSGGTLHVKKNAGSGVTMAMAVAPYIVRLTGGLEG